MYRRWYDQEPNCTKLLVHLRTMKDDEVRLYCARMINHFGEGVRKEIQHKNTAGVTSIGLPGLEYLYKYGTQRRRWYDMEQSIQKAVGILYTLPPEGLVAMGFKLGDTLGLIAVYDMVCAEINQKATMHDLVNISKKALNEGKEEAETLLASIVGEDIYYSLGTQMRGKLKNEI